MAFEYISHLLGIKAPEMVVKAFLRIDFEMCYGPHPTVPLITTTKEGKMYVERSSFSPQDC